MTFVRPKLSRRSRHAGGFILSLTLLLVVTVVIIGSIVGLTALRDGLLERAGINLIKDSSDPLRFLGKPVDYDLCEAPQILCRDLGFSIPAGMPEPGPTAGLFALVGVRPDRFVSRDRIYYSGPDCTENPFIAPPAIPPFSPPDLPVGYLNALESVSYGVGAPSNWPCDLSSPGDCADGGLLYRAGDLIAADRDILSVWTSLAPDCALEGLCVDPPLGMVSWWPGDGNEIDTQDGNSGDGTGGVAYAVGQVGTAFDFDGTSVVNAPNVSGNLNVQNLTIDAWVRPTDRTGEINMIAHKSDAGTIQYQIGIRGADTAGGTIPVGNFAFTIGGQPCNDFSGWCDGLATVPLDVWTHVALTFDGATITAYVNGVPTRTVAYAGPVPVTAGPFRIGNL